MNRLTLVASAAARVAGMPALAIGQHGPGGGHGQGGGQHGGNAGGPHGNHSKGHGPAMAGPKAHGQAMAGPKGHGQGNAQPKAHGPMLAGNGNGHSKGAGGDRVAMQDRTVLVDSRGPGRDNYRVSQLIGGCPPGLAAKNDGCLPPGQAKKLIGSALPQAYSDDALDGPYRSWYRDNDRYYYRMGDGYIYRVDRGSNLISALIPYVDRNFSYYPVGMAYPSEFNYYNVPYQYQSYYPEGGNFPYRYGDGAIYRLDPQTQAIQSIVALLAGDLAVGQRLPPSYGVYNVPLQYRTQYADSANDWYRYNDGYIYRADPTTQLVTAIIKAIV